MARPPKRKVAGGGRPDAKASTSRTTPRREAEPSRYTPPVAKVQKVSPRWVPVLMFTLLGVGALVIVLNYLGLLPGATSNWYLVAGLGAILGGIITATNYH